MGVIIGGHTIEPTGGFFVNFANVNLFVDVDGLPLVLLKTALSVVVSVAILAIWPELDPDLDDDDDWATGALLSLKEVRVGSRPMRRNPCQNTVPKTKKSTRYITPKPEELVSSRFFGLFRLCCNLILVGVCLSLCLLFVIVR